MADVNSRTEDWNTLPWKDIQREVFRLQQRIYQAARRGGMFVNGLEGASHGLLHDLGTVVSYPQQPMCLTTEMLHINKRIAR